MHTLLQKTTEFLSEFLNQILPSISKNWWKETVLEKLSHNQQRELLRQGYTSLAYLDLAALIRILDHNWYQISSKLNINPNNRHYIKEMQTIRNRWAHSGSIDIPFDDMFRDLDTLQRFALMFRAEDSFIAEIKKRKKSLRDKQEEKLIQEKLQEKLREIEIRNNLPKAWAQIISTPDNIIVNLINQHLERLCGLKASKQEIKNYINSFNITDTPKTIDSSITTSNSTTKISTLHQRNDLKPLLKRKCKPRIFPPDGTQCKFTYKGENYTGRIKNGCLKVDGYKEQFMSFSAASGFITKTSRNGWRDWELKTPGSQQWVLADMWRKQNPSIQSNKNLKDPL